MFEFIKKLKNKPTKEKVIDSDYLKRLKNSYRDFSGMSHSCSRTSDKKYLTMSEFSSLLFQELKRKKEEAKQESEVMR